MKEKKDRVDDALHATRAAVQEGIVPGGGVAFIRALSALNNIDVENADQSTGVSIVRAAIETPLRTIATNAGVDAGVIVQKVKEGKDDFGYNARTDQYENLYTTGVIDPTKVARLALENAASITSLLLTTDCLIVDEKEDEKSMSGAGGMGGGMGGMM
jgi:chaperonin GroEL